MSELRDVVSATREFVDGTFTLRNDAYRELWQVTYDAVIASAGSEYVPTDELIKITHEAASYAVRDELQRREREGTL